MVWWIWIVLGAVLLVAEVIIAADFYLVFFGLAAVVLGLLGLAGLALPVWAQWMLFAALAVAGLVFYRNRWRRRFMTPDRPLEGDLVGQRGVARGEIGADGRGRIDLHGATWEAHNLGPDPIPAGSRCAVVRVEGLTLHVRAERGV